MHACIHTYIHRVNPIYVYLSTYRHVCIYTYIYIYIYCTLCSLQAPRLILAEFIAEAAARVYLKVSLALL